jgi:hypothetical protein
VTLLVSDAIAHIRHTLASEDVPSIGAYRILNDAGQYMVNMHNWAWCEGVQETLSLTANQPYVWLPEDFREIMAVQTTNGLNSGFRMTTQDRLLQLRSLAVTNSFEYNGAVVYAPRGESASATVTVGTVVDGNRLFIADAYNPSVEFHFMTTPDDNTATARHIAVAATATANASALATAINDAPNLYVRANAVGAVVYISHSRTGTRGNGLTFTQNGTAFTWDVMLTGIDDGPVRARLELWPTPSQDDSDRLMVYYRRGWQACENDNALIPIPQWCETLYLALVRAIARGYERESEADIGQRIAAVEQSPLAKTAMERDKLSVPHIGAMRGGAAASVRVGYDHMWNFNSVAGPS